MIFLHMLHSKAVPGLKGCGKAGVGILPHEVIHEPKLVATLPSSTQGFHHSCGCSHLSQPHVKKGARGELVGMFYRPGQAVVT